VGIILLAIGLTYAFAWFRASTLSATYLQDADASYDAGNYLDSLVGYEEFDAERNEYIQRGGYLPVERIWRDPYAWPVPSGVERARERVDEVIGQRLSIEDAEQFIQANIGRGNPYMGPIYLRLGELYEEDGDLRSAEEIYASVEELFPNDQELIDRANAHLLRLGRE
jgi:hypothetical protein